MQVSIKTGVQSIDIVRNDEIVGKVEFSLSDPALLTRLRTVAKRAEKIQTESKLAELEDIDAKLDEAERIDKEMRDLLDWAFGAKVADTVFGDSFCFTTCDGVTAMEQFLEGVMPLIEEAFKGEVDAAKERQAKYLAKYKR
jgi:hypothetical protein